MTIKRNIIFCLVLVAGVNVYGMDIGQRRQLEQRQQRNFDRWIAAKRLEEEKQWEEREILIKDKLPRPGMSMMLENEVLMHRAAERQAQEKEQKK